MGEIKDVFVNNADIVTNNGGTIGKSKYEF